MATQGKAPFVVASEWTDEYGQGRRDRESRASSQFTTLSDPFAVDGETATVVRIPDDIPSFSAFDRVDDIPAGLAVVQDDSTIDDTGETAVSSLLQKYHYDTHAPAEAQSSSSTNTTPEIETGRAPGRLHHRLAICPQGSAPTSKLVTPVAKPRHTSDQQSHGTLDPPTTPLSYGSTDSLLRLTRRSENDLSDRSDSIPSIWRMNSGHHKKILSPIEEASPPQSRPVSSIHPEDDRDEWETIYNNRDWQSTQAVGRVSSETFRHAAQSTDDDRQPRAQDIGQSESDRQHRGKRASNPSRQHQSGIYSPSSASSSLPRSPRVPFAARTRDSSLSSSPLSLYPASPPFSPTRPSTPSKILGLFNSQPRARLWDEDPSPSSSPSCYPNPFAPDDPAAYCDFGTRTQRPEAILMQPIAKVRTPVIVRGGQHTGTTPIRQAPVIRPPAPPPVPQTDSPPAHIFARLPPRTEQPLRGLGYEATAYGMASPQDRLPSFLTTSTTVHHFTPPRGSSYRIKSAPRLPSLARLSNAGASVRRTFTPVRLTNLLPRRVEPQRPTRHRLIPSPVSTTRRRSSLAVRAWSRVCAGFTWWPLSHWRAGQWGLLAVLIVILVLGIWWAIAERTKS